MRKILIAICFIVYSQQLVAQNIKFEIELGANTSTTNEKGNPAGYLIPNYSYTSNNAYTEGYHVGILINSNREKIDIQTGLIYTTKGGNADDLSIIPQPLGPIYDVSYDHRQLQYLEIPLNITYNFPFDDFTFFVGGGPYFDIGLAATYSGTYIEYYNTSTSSGSFSRDNYFGNGEKKTSLGVNSLGGVRFKNGFSFKAGFQFGLTNVSPESDITSRINTLTLSFAYTLFSLNHHQKR